MNGTQIFIVSIVTWLAVALLWISASFSTHLMHTSSMDDKKQLNLEVGHGIFGVHVERALNGILKVSDLTFNADCEAGSFVAYSHCPLFSLLWYFVPGSLGALGVAMASFVMALTRVESSRRAFYRMYAAGVSFWLVSSAAVVIVYFRFAAAEFKPVSSHYDYALYVQLGAMALSYINCVLQLACFDRLLDSSVNYASVSRCGADVPSPALVLEPPTIQIV
jgi:hypothetical protein